MTQLGFGFDQKVDFYQKLEFDQKGPLFSQKVDFDPEIFLDKKSISVNNSNFDQKVDFDQNFELVGQ